MLAHFEMGRDVISAKKNVFSKISNVKVCFCHSQSIPCCVVDPGMFSLAF